MTKSFNTNNQLGNLCWLCPQTQLIFSVLYHCINVEWEVYMWTWAKPLWANGATKLGSMEAASGMNRVPHAIPSKLEKKFWPVMGLSGASGFYLRAKRWQSAPITYVRDHCVFARLALVSWSCESSPGCFTQHPRDSSFLGAIPTA